MQLNFTNFIRFYTGTVEDETINIPRLALIDNKCYCPVYVAGERAAFYINASVPFLDGDDINNLELRILNPDGSLASNLGSIMHRVTLSIGYRMYADFIFPELPSKQYQFQIFNKVTNVPKCLSNWFQVLPYYEANIHTASVVWRNSRSNYYYDWQLYPDLYSRVRLHISLQSYTPEGTVEQLQSVNTGRRRNLNRTVDKSVKLQTYYFDDGANDACIALFEADDIQINGKKYLAKTIYVPNARSNSKVSTGEIELYEQDFSSVNKYGQFPVELTSQGYIAVYNKSNSIFSLKTYDANNILFQSTNVAVNGTLFFPIGSIPYGGKVNFVAVAPGTFDVLTSKSINNDVVFTENNISTPVSLSIARSDVYNADWVVVLSGEAELEPANVVVTLTEQVSPFVDGNAQLKIDGVEQFTLNVNGATDNRSAPAGSTISIEEFVGNYTDVPGATITLTVKKNGVDLFPPVVLSATIGASAIRTFVAEAAAAYVITVVTSS